MPVRLCAAEDVASLMEVVRRVVPIMRADGNLQWDHEYPNAAVFERDIQLQQLWAEEIEGEIAGFAAITHDHEPEYAQVGWDLEEPAFVVHRLAVDPRFRGRGVAATLMKHAETLAEELGISVLRVDTNASNQATQKLFPKLGYALAGEIALGFRPGLRFYCYEKMLSLSE